MMPRLLTVLCCLLLVLPTSAQLHDGEGWAGVGASYKVNKKTSLSGTLQLRANSWGRQVKTVFATGAINYKYNKHVRLKANYRYGPRWNMEGFSATRHRANGDLTLRTRKKPFTYSLRFRYQLEYDNILNREVATPRSYTFRLKPKVSYRVNKKTDVSAIVEIFQPLFEQSRVDNLRFGVGLAKDLKKGRSVSYRYAWEQAINVPKPGTVHIVGVVYDFSFK